jgi:hypothetical protein
VQPASEDPTLPSSAQTQTLPGVCLGMTQHAYPYALSDERGRINKRKHSVAYKICLPTSPLCRWQGAGDPLGDGAACDRGHKGTAA